MVNPNNIVRLLKISLSAQDFERDSNISEDEEILASQLEIVIKDCVNTQRVFESSTSLCFADDSVIPETHIVEDEDDIDEEDMDVVKRRKVCILL